VPPRYLGGDELSRREDREAPLPGLTPMFVLPS
jgi:hypothetical protein